MISNLDVLGSWLDHCILCNGNPRLAVLVDNRRRTLYKSKILKHIPWPNWFLHSIRESNILCFSSRERERESSCNLLLGRPDHNTRVDFEQLTTYCVTIILVSPRRITVTTQLQTFTKSSSGVSKMIILCKLKIADHSFCSNQVLLRGLRDKLGKFSSTKSNVRPCPNHCRHQWNDKISVKLFVRFIQYTSRWIQFLLEVHGCRSLDRLAVLHHKPFQKFVTFIDWDSNTTSLPSSEFEVRMRSATLIAIIANETAPLTSCSLLLYIRIENCRNDIQLNQSKLVKRSNINQQSNEGKIATGK